MARVPRRSRGHDPRQWHGDRYGNFNVAGGTLAGTGVISSNMTLSSGWRGIGTGTLTTQGTSVVTGTINLTGGKTWVNQGTLTVGGAGAINFGYASGGTNNSLTNAAGATLNLSSSTGEPLAFYTGTAILNNAGTLNHTVSGTHSINGNISFNNTGAVNISVGTLSINGSGTDTGTQRGPGRPATLGHTNAQCGHGHREWHGCRADHGGTTYVNGTVTGTGNFNVAGGTLAGTGCYQQQHDAVQRLCGWYGHAHHPGTSVVTGTINLTGGKTWEPGHADGGRCWRHQLWLRQRWDQYPDQCGGGDAQPEQLCRCAAYVLHRHGDLQQRRHLEPHRERNAFDPRQSPQTTRHGQCQCGNAQSTLAVTGAPIACRRRRPQLQRRQYGR